MSDGIENKASDATGEGEATSGNTQPVNAQYVTQEDFRKYQSTKDREIAAERQQREAAAQRAEELEAKLESLISDPVEKAKFQAERTQAQLEYYRQKDAMEGQKRWFTEKYGVPSEAMAEAKDPADLTLAVLEWQKAQREAVATTTTKTQKEKEVEEVEESGGHTVSMTPGTPPERQAMSDDQITKEIEQLRTIAQKGGSAGDRARVNILKLESQRQKSRSSRSRV